MVRETEEGNRPARLFHFGDVAFPFVLGGLAHVAHCARMPGLTVTAKDSVRRVLIHERAKT